MYLPPYEAGVKAGACTVMSAFNDLNGIPASANPYTLTEILRNRWGFKGFVVSDWYRGPATDDPGVRRRRGPGGAEGDQRRRRYGHDRRPLSEVPERPGRKAAGFRSRRSMRRSGGSCASSSPWGCSSIRTARRFPEKDRYLQPESLQTGRGAGRPVDRLAEERAQRPAHRRHASARSP